MDLEGYQFIQREIGEDAVYPGHPVTVGLLIMRAFPTLEAASDRGPRPDAHEGHQPARATTGTTSERRERSTRCARARAR